MPYGLLISNHALPLKALALSQNRDQISRVRTMKGKPRPHIRVQKSRSVLHHGPISLPPHTPALCVEHTCAFVQPKEHVLRFWLPGLIQLSLDALQHLW